MKRFWTLVGVAVVAGAMYVAAAPGSPLATSPTAKQFNALKKQVAALSKSLTAEKKDEAQVKLAATAAVDYIGGCFLDTSGNIQSLAVDQLGTTASGFLFGPPGGTGSTARTALDLDTSGTPMAYLQEVAPACATATASAMPHSLKLWAERSR